MNIGNIEIIAFDADDTLWHNEKFFREAEEKFCELMGDYMPEHAVLKELFRVEMDNLSTYGYGIKSFMLSMIQTALEISEGKLPNRAISAIIKLGKEMLHKPVEIMPGIPEVLNTLKSKYRLVMATKGDLLDQERKLEKSGLQDYFHHIEVMSEKKEKDYKKLINHLDIRPYRFLMIGNSVKSDILPVLKVGGLAIHIPYHITWEHERVDAEIDHPNFYRVEKAHDVLNYL
jgi:putative hydrolase of the HAD superfamily